MTAVITGEKGDGNSITRYGLEEYVADCVIILDQRIQEQISTRRLRVLKYRGTAHGMNEYPFLIGAHGFSVLPITSLQLDHEVSIAAGPHGHRAPRRDAGRARRLSRQQRARLRLAGHGQEQHRRAKFVEAACRRGERALFFAYEESSAQIVRNMRSVGIDLEPWVKKGAAANPLVPPDAARAGAAPGDRCTTSCAPFVPTSSPSIRSAISRWRATSRR